VEFSLECVLGAYLLRYGTPWKFLRLARKTSVLHKNTSIQDIQRDGKALEQAAQKNCVGVQGQVGWGPVQPYLVGGDQPTAGIGTRWFVKSLPIQAVLWFTWKVCSRLSTSYWASGISQGKCTGLGSSLCPWSQYFFFFWSRVTEGDVGSYHNTSFSLSEHTLIPLSAISLHFFLKVDKCNAFSRNLPTPFGNSQLKILGPLNFFIFFFF